VNKALLDTDIYSEILKAVDQTVTQNATAYRRYHGVLYFTRPYVRHHTAEGRALVTASRVVRAIRVAPTDSGGRKARRAAEDADAQRSKSAHTLQGRETAILRHLMTGLGLTCDTGIIETGAVSRNVLPRLRLCVTQE
jgi:hypothetical protein